MGVLDPPIRLPPSGRPAIPAARASEPRGLGRGRPRAGAKGGEGLAHGSGAARGGTDGHAQTPSPLPRGAGSGSHRWILLPRDGADPGGPARHRHVAALPGPPDAPRFSHGTRGTARASGAGAMTCGDLVHAIDPYLDDELSVLEVLRVHAHLLRCNPCRTAMESEARLHSLLEADALQDSASPALRDRILQQLAAVAFRPASSGRRRRRGATAYAVLGVIVLVAALVAGVTVLRFTGAPDLTPFVEEVAAKHLLYTERSGPALGLETADVGRLAVWLTGQVGFPIRAPSDLRPGEHLVGGRISSLGDAPAAYLLYEQDQHPVSLFITRRPPSGSPEGNRWVVDGMELYTSRLGRLTLVWWEDEEYVYAAASTASRRDLAEFALLCARSARTSG